MNEQFNRQISFILEKYGKDPPTLIQELFNLLPFQKPEERKITQTAILYSMETIHEWENIYHYIQKWELDSFRATLIQRMGRRLDEEVGSIANSNEELLRLIEKYWLTRSPKKEQNRYKEPIDIKLITKKMQASTGKPLAQQQFKTENAPAGENSKESANPQNNSMKNSRSTVSQVEAFNSLTGRPAILKKGSMFDLNRKNNKQEPPKTKETKPLEISVKTQKASSGEFVNKKMEIEKPKTNQLRDEAPVEEKPKNVLKQLADFCGKTSKDQRVSHIEPPRPEKVEEVEMKQSQTSSNAGSNSQPNQPYPSVDQFCFGSMKKTKDGDLKRLTISPNKRHSVSNKIVKIRRTEAGEPQPENHKEEGFHNDFSFMNDNFEVLKPMSLPSSDPFACPHTSSSETLPEFVQKEESQEIENMRHFAKAGPYSEEITPIFMDSKSDQKMQFLSPEELKMVEEVEPQHYMRTFMKNKGITMMNIFHEEMRKLGLR